MVKRRTPASTKTQSLLMAFLFVAAGGVTLLFFGLKFFLGQANSIPDTVVIVGNPSVVVFWDQPSRQARLVTLSPELVVEGVYDTGRYSLASLWTLGTIDKKDRGVFVMSLEEALGVPIPYYIGSESIITFLQSPIEIVKSIFSFRSIPAYGKGRFKTNLGIIPFFRFVLRFGGIDATNMKVLALNESQVTVEEPLPDGALVKRIAPTRLDAYFDHFFEIDDIRVEALRIAIYNTTLTPALGARFSRLLSSVGANVVFVGNENTQLPDCIVEGTKQHLNSHTGAFLRDYFHCINRENPEITREDLVVKVGATYQKRFLPR